MSEFLTIGEPIALFGSEEVDKSLKDACHFQKFLAGAEVNVAVGVSRLGIAANTLHRSEKILSVNLSLTACMRIKLEPIIFLKLLIFGQHFN